MTVAKGAIVGRDLGLYVTEQLKQVIDHEIAYLTEVQDIERKQVSQKVVAVAYSGLVGAFLDDRTEVLPGYTPVVSVDSGQWPRLRARLWRGTAGHSCRSLDAGAAIG